MKWQGGRRSTYIEDRRGLRHGTAEQRARWFRQGLSSGEMNACDTFRQGAR